MVASVAGLLSLVYLVISWLAPTEETMGSVQRILYIHVSVAWIGLLGCVVTAATGLVYLLRRDIAWDHWSQASAELGWICCTLTLVTGSLWASQAWNTWWTWDPRLTTVFILWLIYSGYLLARSSLDDPQQRARVGAVLAILGALDVPLVIMATRWFRGIHPVAPEMEPSMRWLLVLSAFSFTALFGLMLAGRRAQIQLEYQIGTLESRLTG
jgi:heme exporter protein C